MNRRLVLISQAETPDFAKYWGCGLGNEIYTLEQLEAMDKIDRENCLRVGVGDGVLLVGAEPFKYLQEFYHFGIRSENYFDCAKLYRLSIEGGAFVRVIVDFPELDQIADFLSENFTKPVDFSWFKQKILKTYEEAIKFLDYLCSLPENEDFGFDYEASGMPLDKWFEISGASICTTRFGGFISFTDIRHTATKEQYQDLLYRLGQFLLKRQEHVWTYNMQYEFQVSYRMLGVDLYNLCDASVVNVLDGHHLKKYSLKWTAQRILGASVWDTEFDRISDLIDSMLFTEEGKLKKDKHKVLKVDQTNFKNTPEWAELTRRYPNYIGQFESLVLEYWGNAFMPIPSDILGFYCNLDAFYTLMIYKYKENEYSKSAFNVFMDNLRLACRLHSCGIPKDEKFRAEYNDYCEKQMAWGITYCATARCKIKMNKHRGKMADITKYTPVAAKLLRQNKFYNGNTVEIAKDILSNHVDTMDISELGLNEGLLLLSYGSDFSDKFLEITRQSMEEVGMIKEIIDRKTKQSLGKEVKAKIDINVARKKKLVGLVGEKLVHVLGLDKFKLDNKHLELEKYLYYERAYNELLKISQTQLNDINNIPDHIFAFGQNMTLQEYSDFVSDNYFKCKSPIEDVEICTENAELYKSESAYLTALFESTQQLPGAEKYYDLLGIKTIEDGFSHFMGEWQKYYTGTPSDQTAYPEKMYTLALEYYNNPSHDNVRETWNNLNGYQAQATLFPYVNDQCEDYEKVFNEDDLNNNFFFMRKLVLNYLRYKKHAKLKSTYVGIDGMFGQTDTLVLEDPNTHIMIREAEPGEPNSIVKMRPHFSCMEKSSKRWASGYHTIISHSDIKRTVCSYPGCLLTYFDISSAEVKSAGFKAGEMAKQRHGPEAKTELINTFLNGIDVYIRSAKVFLGEEHWNKLSKKEQKSWRKKFKTVTLGLLYGLGVSSLAERLNTTPEEATRIQKSMFDMYPELREYIEYQQQYPLEHDGYINTFFGDKLKVEEWKYYKAATNARERKGQEARIKRLGVNLPIQGGTSTAMSSGFFNDLRVAKECGWNLTSFITVHDSNTCNLPADKIWEIRKFYDKNFTGFCYKMTGINLLFDLEVGANYNDTCSMKQIDDNTIEFTGTAESLLQIINKMNECQGLKYETSIPISDIIPNYIQNSTKRFILDSGCCMRKDISNYTVQFKKIS